MILSDRVLVMNAGRIAQDGTPRQIYEEPRTRFVMDFLGQVDHVDARVARRADGSYVARLVGAEDTEVPLARDQEWREGEEAVLAFRSADVQVQPGSFDGAWPGTVVTAVYLGERVEYVIEIGASQVRAWGSATEPLSKGTAIQLQVPASAIRAWPVRR